MEETEARYTPRAGSKVALGIEQLAHGPATNAQLALAMDCEEVNIGALLQKAKDAGAVIRVNDAQGVLHWALASAELPPGFVRKGISAIEAADPFGLAAKRNGAGGDAQGTMDADKSGSQELAAPGTHVDPARPIAPARGPFLAALFSTGELMIQVGDDQIFLGRDHQRQLQQYCARFKE